MTSAFSLADLLRTSRGPNPITPTVRYGRQVTAGEINQNLEALRVDILEPLALALGRGRLTSCYRSPTVNAAVGGSTNSAHLVGLAADWQPAVAYPAAIAWLAARELPLDRVILEERARSTGTSRWLHLQRHAPGHHGQTSWYHSPRAGVYLATSAEDLARIAALKASPAAPPG